jgi:DNA-binding response OmpR family regulator
MATIIVVEDNDSRRDALGRWLQQRGYEVLLAADGREAELLARARTPDLILANLGQLPIRFEQLLEQIKGLLPKNADASTQH